jgi:hypothetical protein
MPDARLDDVLCRVDTITNRLAASNCGSGEQLSEREQYMLLQELQHLNTRLAVRFAAMAAGPAYVPRPLTKVIGGLCAGAALLLVMLFVFAMFASMMHDVAMSFAQMARPVP